MELCISCSFFFLCVYAFFNEVFVMIIFSFLDALLCNWKLKREWGEGGRKEEPNIVHRPPLCSYWLANGNIYFEFTPSMCLPGWEMNLLIFWDYQLAYILQSLHDFILGCIYLPLQSDITCISRLKRQQESSQEIQFQRRKKTLRSIKCDILQEMQSPEPKMK